MFYIFPRVIKPEVCEQITKDCKENILEKAQVERDDELINDQQVRKTSVYFIKDKDNKINELVWGFLREANKIQFNYDLKYFQPIQFAEYKKDGFYGWHQDQENIDKSNEIRKLSLSLILSDPNTFEGGELQFYTGDRPMPDIGNITGKQVINDIKAQGTVIVFDSRDWHRVTPIMKGIRYSLVCWCLGPNFR